MASTYLNAVNQVLVKLRESQVSTVSATPYSSLIGSLVNDAKREVEDAWQWSALLDYLQFNSSNNVFTYDMANVNTALRGTPAIDRSRLWVDPTLSKPMLICTTPQFENRLDWEPTVNDQWINQANTNNGITDIPKRFQIWPSTTTTAGQWNKQVRLYATPNGIYTFQLYIVNPNPDMANDTDYFLCPTAPVVLKAYLFALFERGEELGEQLTLTQNKVEESLGDAIAYDQNIASTQQALSVPYGAQY